MQFLLCYINHQFLPVTSFLSEPSAILKALNLRSKVRTFLGYFGYPLRTKDRIYFLFSCCVRFFSRSELKLPNGFVPCGYLNYAILGMILIKFRRENFLQKSRGNFSQILGYYHDNQDYLSTSKLPELPTLWWKLS